jgi:hypothetical protein
MNAVFVPRRSPCSTLLLCAALLSGCASFGPDRVPSDRFDYNDAIARSTKEQMLANIVRVRYADFPTFLSVSSVITSYTYNGGVGVQGTAGLSGSLAVDSVGGSANLSYSERPTISYAPLAGQEFTRRLLAPIPVRTIFALAQAGWAVDLLLLTGIHRVNDVENMAFAAVPALGSPGIEEQRTTELRKLQAFQRLIELFLLLSDAGVIEVHAGKDEADLPTLVIADEVPDLYQSSLDEFRTTLDLDPDLDSFRFTTRLTGRARGEITIQSRSLMSIMSFVAKGVELPAAHVEAGWATGFATDGWESAQSAIPLRVRSQAGEPANAFASVRYGGAWFFIDHRDLRSKRMFVTLQALFELQAPAGSAAAPLLTLPTGP